MLLVNWLITKNVEAVGYLKTITPLWVIYRFRDVSLILLLKLCEGHV
jgi:hypothetical protein